MQTDRKIMEQLRLLEQVINEMAAFIPRQDARNTGISKGAVGWHIEHSLITLDLIIEHIRKSDPATYRASVNWKKALVMLPGRIPRRTVKAPKMVEPEPGFNEASLLAHLNRTKENLQLLLNISPGHYFRHPIMGNFRLKPAIRFMRIHTRHHLQIIREILIS